MNMKNTEQVGEVQGDARAQFEAWSKSAGLETKIYAHNDMYSHPVTRGAWMAWQHLAARQTGTQEAIAWQINAKRSGWGWENCTRECYEDTLRTGRYMGLPAGARDVEVRQLYATPPAQGIDLGRALDIMWNWQEQLGGHVFDARDVARTLTSSDMQAIGVDARACIDATDRNQAIVLAKREIVRALIDQRAAAPGVGS